MLSDNSYCYPAKLFTMSTHRHFLLSDGHDAVPPPHRNAGDARGLDRLEGILCMIITL